MARTATRGRRFDAYEIESVTGGTDALGVTSIKIKDKNGIVVAGNVAHEDIVMSSVQAVINALIKFMKMRKKGTSNGKDTTAHRSTL